MAITDFTSSALTGTNSQGTISLLASGTTTGFMVYKNIKKEDGVFDPDKGVFDPDKFSSTVASTSLSLSTSLLEAYLNGPLTYEQMLNATILRDIKDVVNNLPDENRQMLVNEVDKKLQAIAMNNTTQNSDTLYSTEIPTQLSEIMFGNDDYQAKITEVKVYQKHR